MSNVTQPFSVTAGNSFMDSLHTATTAQPRTIKEAVKFATTRAWYYVCEYHLVGTPAEDRYTLKCISNARKEWAHLPEE